MVVLILVKIDIRSLVSVLALSSRFDGRRKGHRVAGRALFQYSLCRVVLMVCSGVMAFLSIPACFSTRSVESF